MAISWLSIAGTQVQEGASGPRYRAAGYNCYVMLPDGGAAGQTMTEEQYRKWMADIRPNSLIRMWAFAPLATYSWAQRYAQLDAVVAAAKVYGHRLVFGLTDWHGNANDLYGAKTSTWFTSQTYLNSVSGSTSYEDWVKAIAARYSTEPTVAIYDLMNEPSDSGSNTASINTFVTTVKGWLDSLVPNALVTMGVAFPSALGGAGTTNYETIFTNLDICTAHDYDSACFVNKAAASLTAARNLTKPLIIDEYGFWAKPQYEAQGGSDVDTNSLPAMSFRAQGQAVENFLKSAYAEDEIFATLIWSAMDIDSGSWLTSSGLYEPVNQAVARQAVKTVDLAQTQELSRNDLGTFELWVDSANTLRYPPGTQVGGAASGATLPNVFHDRKTSSNFRNSTQANSPTASVALSRPSALFTSGTTWVTFTGVKVGNSGGLNQIHSFYAVVYLTSAGVLQYLFAPAFAATAALAARITSGNIFQIMRYGSAPNTGGTVIASSSTTLATGAYYLLDAQYNGSTGAYSLGVNGKVEATGTSALALSDDSLRLGCTNVNTDGLQGHLLEFIKQGVVSSATERAKAIAYLSAKYGIQI